MEGECELAEKGKMSRRHSPGKVGDAALAASARIDHVRAEFTQGAVNAQQAIAQMFCLRIQQSVKRIAVLLTQFA